MTAPQFPTAYITEYDLPDVTLLSGDAGDRAVITWTPEQLVAVIGCGSDAAKELNLQAVQSEGVRIIRRPTGGCAVILSPHMYATSFVMRSRSRMKSAFYFSLFGDLLVEVLKALGPSDIHKAGTSDIALGNRKIAGSALYRTRDMVFYHAVVNVSERPETISRLLAKPPREPGYRNGRPHTEFITSLEENGCRIEFPDFRDAIGESWRRIATRKYALVC